MRVIRMVKCEYEWPGASIHMSVFWMNINDHVEVNFGHNIMINDD